jgi:hypothetical protein
MKIMNMMARRKINNEKKMKIRMKQKTDDKREEGK